MPIQEKDIPSYRPIEPDNFGFFYPAPDDMDNPERTIKYCFSVFYADGLFLKAIYYILAKYESFWEEGTYCFYPDFNSPDPDEYFLGIEFVWGFDMPDWVVYVPEKVCFAYAKEACERFLELHPEQQYRNFLNQILDNWQPLGIDCIPYKRFQPVSNQPKAS